MNLDADTAAELDRAVTPDRVEVHAVAGIILKATRNGIVNDGALRMKAVQELGGDAAFDAGYRHGRNHLQVSGPDSISRDDPLVTYHRLHYATQLAIDHLVRAGLPRPVKSAPPGATTVSVDTGGSRFGHRPFHPEPDSHTGHFIAASALPGLGPDLAIEPFLAGTDDLELEDRTRRCLHEAIDAHDTGLELAAANLLAAVVEGAWYAVGGAHPQPPTKLTDALERDQTAKVMQLVSDWLRGGATQAQKVRCDEVHAFASLMRSVRNYGVHPRTKVDDGIEAHFTSSAVAVLIMQVPHHVRSLHELRDAALER